MYKVFIDITPYRVSGEISDTILLLENLEMSTNEKREAMPCDDIILLGTTSTQSESHYSEILIMNIPQRNNSHHWWTAFELLSTFTI